MTSQQHPRRNKAVTYRVSPNTYEKLEALKLSLGENTTQAETIEYLLALADVGRSACEHLSVRPADLPARITELVEQGALVTALHQQIGGLHAKVADLQYQLQHSQTATQPVDRPAVSNGHSPSGCAPCGSFRW